ncbi:MAG: hypothetical protein HY262_07330, partial [Chloroflexi bacterium]|nr:hypothetical protein [Chloroflexota bacterium]
NGQPSATVELRGLGVAVEIPGTLKGGGKLAVGAGGQLSALLDVEVIPAKIQVVGALQMNPPLTQIDVGVRFATGLPLGASGLGLYGFLMAVSSRVFTQELRNSPGMLEAVRNMVPGVDMTTTAGFLQLAFVDLGLVLVALAAATFVAGRASDESGGRLELLLSTPLTRARWTIASAIGVWLAIVVTDALLAASIAVGVGLAGSDPVQPLIGSVALALYGAAMAGIGLAVGGLTRASFAAPAVLVVAIGSSLVDILGDALGLPDWFRQMALSSHMGEPMVGTWDPVGVAVSLILAVGGLGLGLWGMRHRDVST